MEIWRVAANILNINSHGTQAWTLGEGLMAPHCKNKKLVMKYYIRVYPKVSGLATWSENSKWYISLPLGAVVSLFCEPV
jgi:hypothetical protein